MTPELKAFFRGAGVPRELLEALPRIVSEIKYQTCFVSYGEPDLKFSEKLTKGLEARGVSCWLFPLDAKPGAGLEKEIEDNIRRSEKMIVICSKASLVRQGVLKELKSQINKDVDNIVPVSLDNVWTGDDFHVEWERQNLKPFLNRQIYADFSDPSGYEESLEVLLRGVMRVEKQVPSEHPEIPEAVRELYAQFSQYALPDDELRKIVDRDMGTKTLTEELYKMREE